MKRTHTFDEGMKCIRCRIEYAQRAEPCSGEGRDARELGSLARRNIYLERQQRQKAEALKGMIR